LKEEREKKEEEEEEEDEDDEDEEMADSWFGTGDRRPGGGEGGEGGMGVVIRWCRLVVWSWPSARSLFLPCLF
jgi:hypothetical protein